MEQEQNQMKKDLAEVKAYAEAMADSNCARDAYVDKEQDKFFCRVNRQRADLNALKEQMERSELRAKALELENESLLAHLDSMVDKLCFCTRAEVTSQVVGSEISSGRNSDVILPRSIEPSPSLNMLKSRRTIHHTLKRMLSRASLSRLRQNAQQTFQSLFQLRPLMPCSRVVQVVRFLTSQ